MNVSTVFFTVVSGTLVYVLGQLLSKFVVDPIYELRKTIGEVRFNLSFYGPPIHTPVARDKEVSDKAGSALLKSSSDLFSKLHAVPFYFGLLPARQSIERAADQLRGLSTDVYSQNATARDLERIAAKVKNIEKLLGLKPLE
jgi:hypothetical protein